MSFGSKGAKNLREWAHTKVAKRKATPDARKECKVMRVLPKEGRRIDSESYPNARHPRGIYAQGVVQDGGRRGGRRSSLILLQD